VLAGARCDLVSRVGDLMSNQQIPQSLPAKYLESDLTVIVFLWSLG
jgi:hypothetical protein